jgi:hypothetical protein
MNIPLGSFAELGLMTLKNILREGMLALYMMARGNE